MATQFNFQLPGRVPFFLEYISTELLVRPAFVVEKNWSSRDKTTNTSEPPETRTDEHTIK
jgi:hypothetical protein